jgi:transposase InsO family protein
VAPGPGRASHRAGPDASQRCRVAQYTSFRFTAHLIESGIDASIGTVGAYDNALMESATGLSKTELINKHGPWKSLADVELATAGHRVVQQQETSQRDRAHPARRTRSQLLRSNRTQAPG